MSLSNYELLVSFLHPSGANYGTLAPSVEAQCYKIASGDSWELCDWSFIRDADDSAIAKMAELMPTI